MSARRKAPSSGAHDLRARRPGEVYRKTVDGSTGNRPLDDYESLFPDGLDGRPGSFPGDAIVGAEVDAEDWPAWTDRVAFGAVEPPPARRGVARAV